MPFQQVYNEYNRLNDPAYQEGELRARLARANPQLRSLLEAVRGDLNTRGLFSASPMATASARATGEFTGGITQDFYQGLDSKRMGLLQLIAELEQFQEQMKAQKESSKWGAIGQLLGFGASFIPGNPLSFLSGGGGGGGFSNMGGGNLNVNSGYYPRR